MSPLERAELHRCLEGHLDSPCNLGSPPTPSDCGEVGKQAGGRARQLGLGAGFKA